MFCFFYYWMKFLISFMLFDANHHPIFCSFYVSLKIDYCSFAETVLVELLLYLLRVWIHRNDQHKPLDDAYGGKWDTFVHCGVQLLNVIYDPVKNVETVLHHADSQGIYGWYYFLPDACARSILFLIFTFVWLCCIPFP